MDSNALKKGTAECPRCGTLNVAGSLVCVLCKAALQRRASGSLLRSASAAPSVAPQTGSNSYVVDSHEPSLDLRAGRESLRFLGLGLLLSPVFAFLPYLQFFDWFLTSLFHESGHCFFAWMMGQPAFPAISLTGHAAAMHQDQSVLLAVCVAAGLAGAAWHCRGHTLLRWAFGVAAVLQPILAFTSAKEVLFLLGGHLGELTFATICIWRTLQGGFTQNNLERVLYGVLGWYLVGHNLSLSFGLLFSESARQVYATNGSFGMTNDYLRLAHEVLGVSLSSVAFVMLLVSLIPVPLALVLWRKGSH